MKNFEQWHDKTDIESLGLLAQCKVVREQQTFFIAIEHEDPKWFFFPMISCFPFEIRLDGEIYLQAASCHWLGIGVDLYPWHMVDKFMDNFSQLWNLCEFSNLLWSHLIK